MGRLALERPAIGGQTCLYARSFVAQPRLAAVVGGRRLRSSTAGTVWAAQQAQEARQQEERRRSSEGASTSSAPTAAASSTTSTTTSTASSLLQRLLRRKKGEAKPRNTSVDEKYKPFLDEWDRGFVEGQEDPEGHWLEPVYGAVPRQLQGTLFRNGPGRFCIGADKVAHPYDGDGLILSIAFRDGHAYFRSRFVRTAEYEAESGEERILFRGTFATQRPGGPAKNAFDVYVKNTSNTNVTCWGGRLWSLFEAGQPYRLDPRTLQTEGLETLDGQLNSGLPFDMGSPAANDAFAGMTRATQERLGSGQRMPPKLFAAGGDAVTAHPHVDANTGRLVTFSYRVGPSISQQPVPPLLGTELTFWEFDQEFQVAAKKSFRLKGFAFLHDFAVTENYYVVFQNPVTVDNVPYLLGRAPAAACVRWVPGQPTLVHIIPRPGKTDAQGRPLEARCYKAPPLFVFHHANSYEADGGRRLVIDSIQYDSLPAVGREALAEQQIDPDVAFRSRLRRVEIDLQTNVQRLTTAFDDYLEMCCINEAYQGRRHRYVYGYNSVFDVPQIGIAKVDMDANRVSLWRPGHRKFALEPKFVARPGAKAEDDGWLLTVMFDSGTQRSQLVILDARDLEKGPVAVLDFKQPIPSGLHGCWSGTYYGPDEAPSPSAANVVPFGASTAAAKGAAAES